MANQVMILKKRNVPGCPSDNSFYAITNAETPVAARNKVAKRPTHAKDRYSWYVRREKDR
jgi:hypothetical protein